jgi:cell division protein FtsL
VKIFLVIILFIAVIASAIDVVLAKHKARKFFVEIQELEQRQDELNEEWGKLQLEQSTWSTDDRVEELARTKLEMTEPDVSSLVLIMQ